MKVQKVIAATGLVFALGLAAAPVALADEDSYLSDINQGIGAVEVNSGDWLDLGYTACDIGNLTDATNYIYSHTGSNTTVDQAQFAAESAFMFLC